MEIDFITNIMRQGRPIKNDMPLMDTLLFLIVGGGVDYKIWIFGVNFGFLSQIKRKKKCFEQILVVVSFTTDHDKQFYTHFTYPLCLVFKFSQKSCPLLHPPLQLWVGEYACIRVFNGNNVEK